MTKYKEDFQKELLNELKEIEGIVQRGEESNNADIIETFMTKLIRFLEKFCPNIKESEAYKKLVKLYTEDLKLIYMNKIIAISRGLLECS